MKSGTNLAYRTWGIRGGAPIVLLHGFLGDSSDWEMLARELENDFYMVAVDLPGHGQSKEIRVTQDNDFHRFSQLLTATLSQLGLRRYSLMGYSLGGRLAMYHAAHAPQFIDKLIVESAHPGLDLERERKDRWVKDQAWAEKFRTEPLMEVLERWYHQPVFADLDSSSRAVLMKDRCEIHQNGERLADCLEAFSLAKQPGLWSDLMNTSYVVHYLHGERDLKFQGVAQRLRELGSGLGIHSVKNAGHNIHRQQPQAMGQLIHQLFV